MHVIFSLILFALAVGLFHIPVYKLKVELMIYKMRNIFGMDEHSNYLG